MQNMFRAGAARARGHYRKDAASVRQLAASHGAFAAILDSGGVAAW